MTEFMKLKIMRCTKRSLMKNTECIGLYSCMKMARLLILSNMSMVIISMRMILKTVFRLNLKKMVMAMTKGTGLLHLHA